MRITLAIVFVLILLLRPRSVVGQTWLDHYKQSVSLYKSNDLTKAYKEATLALGLFKNTSDSSDPNYRAVLRQVSVTAFSIGKYAEGLPEAKEEAILWQKNPRNGNNSSINALEILGKYYMALSDSEKAREIFQQAFDLAKEQNLDEIGQAVLEGHLADALYDLGQIKASSEHFKKSLLVLDKKEDVPEDYIQFCYSFGLLCNDEKDYKDAVRYFNLMLQWYTDADLRDPVVVEAHIGLGLAYTSLGDLSEGEKYYRSAMASAPSNSKSWIKAIQSLALNLEKQNRGKEAQDLLQQLPTPENAGPRSDDLVLLNNKAGLELQSGNVKEALALFEKALRSIEDTQPSKPTMIFNIYLNAARAYANTGNRTRAIALYKKALVDVSSKDAKYFEAIMELAALYRMEGDVARSSELVSSVEAADPHSWLNKEKAKIFNMIAIHDQYMGKFQDADHYYSKAKVLSLNEDKNLYQTIVFNQLTLQQTLGNFEQVKNSLKDLKSGLAHNPVLYIQTLLRLGKLSRSRAEYAQAENYYSEALGQISDQDPAYLVLLTEQASLKSDQADLVEAERLLLKVRDIRVSQGETNTVAYADLLNSLGVLYQKMGNYPRSAVILEQALDIYEKVGVEKTPAYPSCLENLAAVYLSMGKTDSALLMVSKTVETNRQIFGTNSPDYGASLNNYSVLLQKSGHDKEAKDKLIQAVNIQRSTFGTLHPSYANSLQNLAILYQKEGKLVQADSLLDRVLSIRRSVFSEDHPSITSTLVSKAVVQQGMKHYDTALNLFEIAIDRYLDQVASIFPALSEDEKDAFYSRLTPVVNRYKEFCISYYTKYKPSGELLGKLYDVQLATKAILLNATSKIRNRILRSGNTELISKFNQWNALKDQLASNISLPKEKLEQQGTNLAQLKERANALEKELSQESELFGTTFDKKRLHWQDVQKKLNNKEGAVEIMRIHSSIESDSVLYVALVLSPSFDYPKLIVMNLGTSLESRYYRYYRNTINFQFDDELSYTNYWAPMEKYFSGINKLYISPDGIYNKINLNTFPVPGNSIRILDKYKINYVTSTRELIQPSKGELLDFKKAILIGNPKYTIQDTQPNEDVQRSVYDFRNTQPLPGTQAEIDYIGNLLQKNDWRVASFTGIRASEKNLRSEGSASLLHIATHGFFLQDRKNVEVNGSIDQPATFENPLFRAGLLFSGASNTSGTPLNDGVLSAYEAMNLNFDSTKLVVLSACETALGDIRNGEGVYGLQRAFQVAGVHSIIMSLWKVDDQTTKELMEHFYEYLLKGDEKHIALQKAQNEIREKHKEPYYWGAFVIIGI